MFTNAQKLAAVLAKWLTPAASQILSAKLTQLPAMQSLQSTIISSGLVGANYTLATDIQPFATDGLNTLARPILEQQLSKLPDAALPAMAHNIVDTACKQESYSILDGLLTFELADLEELKDLLDRNLPLEEVNVYEVI